MVIQIIVIVAKRMLILVILMDLEYNAFGTQSDIRDGPFRENS